MVSKTLTALKTENPNGIPQDDLIEQVWNDLDCPWAEIPLKIDLLIILFLGGAIQFGDMAGIVFKKVWFAWVYDFGLAWWFSQYSSHTRN